MSTKSLHNAALALWDAAAPFDASGGTDPDCDCSIVPRALVIALGRELGPAPVPFEPEAPLPLCPECETPIHDAGYCEEPSCNTRRERVSRIIRDGQCHRCHGYGFLSKSTGKPTPGGLIFDGRASEIEDCPLCHGSGDAPPRRTLRIEGFTDGVVAIQDETGRDMIYVKTLPTFGDDSLPRCPEIPFSEADAAHRDAVWTRIVELIERELDAIANGPATV